MPKPRRWLAFPARAGAQVLNTARLYTPHQFRPLTDDKATALAMTNNEINSDNRSTEGAPDQYATAWVATKPTAAANPHHVPRAIAMRTTTDIGYPPKKVSTAPAS